MNERYPVYFFLCKNALNIRNKVLTDYEDITECLVRMPSMEPRAVNFLVKDGKKTQFKEAFNRHFGDVFLLLSKAELLDKKLLGVEKNHDRLEKMLGDFLAVHQQSLSMVRSIIDVIGPEDAAHFVRICSKLRAADLSFPPKTNEKEN